MICDKCIICLKLGILIRTTKCLLFCICRTLLVSSWVHLRSNWLNLEILKRFKVAGHFHTDFSLATCSKMCMPIFFWLASLFYNVYDIQFILELTVIRDFCHAIVEFAEDLGVWPNFIINLLLKSVEYDFTRCVSIFSEPRKHIQVPRISLIIPTACLKHSPVSRDQCTSNYVNSVHTNVEYMEENQLQKTRHLFTFQVSIWLKNIMVSVSYKSTWRKKMETKEKNCLFVTMWKNEFRIQKKEEQNDRKVWTLFVNERTFIREWEFSCASDTYTHNFIAKLYYGKKFVV